MSKESECKLHEYIFENCSPSELLHNNLKCFIFQASQLKIYI